MIVVRVELHSAITRAVSEIARFDIWNVGGDRGHGDYQCASFIGRDREALATRRTNREGNIKNHPRLREHVLHLVAKALTAMNYGKPPREADADPLDAAMKSPAIPNRWPY